MSSEIFAARTTYRSLRSVRRSKTPMDAQEMREKMNRRPSLQRTLVRFRAEYKIRKNWRWVQRSVPFVPDNRLGWLKAVRMCLNLRFRKAEPESVPVPSGLSRTGSTELSSLRNRVRLDPTIHTDAPFPFWWAWWHELRGSVFLYYGKEDLGSVPILEPRPCTGSWRREWDAVANWVLPEALGGPHLRVEPYVVGEDEVEGHGRMVKVPITQLRRVSSSPGLAGVARSRSPQPGAICPVEEAIPEPDMDSDEEVGSRPDSLADTSDEEYFPPSYYSSYIYKILR